MRKTIMAIAAFGLLSVPAGAQMRHWLLKNTLVNMTAHPTYSTSTVPAGSGSDPFTDAVFDESDNLLFYVMGRDIYSAGGTLAASLPSYWDPVQDCMESMDAFKRRGILNKDLIIVPVPKVCKKYYLIYSLMPGAMGSNSMVYVTIDVSSGTPVMGATNSVFFPGCGYRDNPTLIYDFPGDVNSCQAVVSKVYNTGTGNRYLFATGNMGLRRFTISNTGISSGTLIAGPSTPGFTSNYEFRAGDLELSPDQTHISWTPYYYSTDKSVFMVNLSGYNYSSMKKFSNTLATGGLEFNPSSSALYITNSNGIESVSVGAASGTGFTTAFAGSQYASSNLEIGYNGMLYVVNGSTQKLEYKDLVTPSASGSTGVTVTSSSSYGYTEYNIPNQIDGQNYQYFTGANPNYDNLISRDDILDIGAEENVQSTNLWESPDIFNCRTSSTCGTHQNPGYLSPGSGNNYMRVRVKNIGCFTSHPAKVRMYWTLGSTGETWPDSWNGTDEICGIPAGGELLDPGTMTPGYPIPALTPGQSAIVTLPWDPVDPGLFTCESLAKYSDGKPMICLLGRIESAYDGMYSEIPGAISHNVKFNNNIVTRNTSLVPLTGSMPGPIWGGSTSVLLHNSFSSTAVAAVRFGSLSQESGVFGSFGAVELVMGNDLWSEWAAGGYQGQGVEIIDPEDHRVRFANLYNAELRNITLPAGAYRGLTFNFYLQQPVADEGTYSFGVRQALSVAGSGEEEEGSECHFLVRVSNQQGGDEGGFQQISKKIGADVSKGALLFPNPAGTESRLRFRMDQEGRVNITVLDLNGRVVQTVMEGAIMNAGVHNVTIPLDKLSNGIYMVQLRTEDRSTTLKLNVVK